MNIGDSYAGLTLVTPPSYEPMTLQDALQHLRVDSDMASNDAYVTILISLARQYCETVLRRALVTQTWKLSLKNWPGRDYQNWPQSLTSELDLYYKFNFIKLPLPPLQSVTSVSYRNSSGTVLTMSAANFTTTVSNSYNVETVMEPGRIVLPFSGIWPTDILMPGAPINITYVCGYVPLANQTSPPTFNTLEYWEGYQAVIHSMKMLIGYWYENRIPPAEMHKSSVPAGEDMVVNQLLQPYRIRE